MVPRIVVDSFTIRVYTDDHAPAHVHVFRDRAEIRVYLRGNRGHDRICGRMTASEERRALRIVDDYRSELLQMWERYHG